MLYVLGPVSVPALNICSYLNEIINNQHQSIGLKIEQIYQQNGFQAPKCCQATISRKLNLLLATQPLAIQHP